MDANVETDSPAERQGFFNYMSADATSSLYRNGKVLARRDRDGSDDGQTGVDLEKQAMKIRDARQLKGAAHPTLARNGFELLAEPPAHPEVDFFDNDLVLKHYYPQCAEVIRATTGASKVVAFDHNIRSAAGKKHKTRISGGQQVQGPAHVVHGDYTLVSAPQRLRDLTRPPGVNDTIAPLLADGESLLDAEEVETAITTGRFAIINLWRNIVAEPVEVNPLALCDAATVRTEDLVVFEIHYTDRVGENYFAKQRDSHDWYFYPALTREEALLIKQWDSAGELAQSAGDHSDGDNPQAPCTFSFHSAFEDPHTRADAPDRWSMEVRCAVLY